MSVKDEYIKRLEALEEINKIAEENDFKSFINLSTLNASIKNTLRIATIYNNWQLDVNDYGLRNGMSEIEHGIGIYTFSEITNYGKIEPEELLKISFPTGPYIFGNRYDIEFFEEFFEELQLVKPKYKDVLNYSLYYSVDNGKEAYEHYKKTYSKYWNKLEERLRYLEIKELEEKLTKLKGDN